MATLDVDLLRQNQHALVSIDIGVGSRISGFLAEDFSFAVGAQYDADFEGMSDQFNKWARMGVQGLNTVTGAGVAQRQLKHVAQTVYSWSGVERMAFSLNVGFVATSPEHDVRRPIGELIRSCTPTFEGGGFIVKAPLGYTASPSDAEGVCAIQVGKWFQSPPVFVIKTCQPSFSRVAQSNGTPLYAMAALSVEAYRMLSADEIISFISASAI